jgi:hypothetical protein
MNGLSGAVLTVSVGAALLLTAWVALAMLRRAVLGGSSGFGRFGCGVLLLLCLLWFISGLAGGTGQTTSPQPHQAAHTQVVE